MEQDKKPIKIRIITTEPFPVGLAATNRIMTYAKGLAEQNCLVFVHCIKPTERPDHVFNKNSSGMIGKVTYSYPGGKTILDSNFLKRRADNFIGISKMLLEILREKKIDRTNAIIYYSAQTIPAIFIFLVTRIKHIIFLKEESESPDVYLAHKTFLEKFLFKRLHYHLFDGLLLMTNKLIRYFTEIEKIKAPVLHVPMTVDFERFQNLENTERTESYIAYCGLLNNKKDGTNILIEAFTRLTVYFPSIKLYLIGDAINADEYKQYVKQVQENGIANKVVFTGRLSGEKIPEILTNAKLLVLPRPASLQSESGFPTKLGEYLSTGNPVVVTKVGEIGQYLTDRVSAFMAEPGNIDSLFLKIQEALTDYPNARNVGARGKEIVLREFNYRIQTGEILNLIKSLNRCVA